MRVFVYLLRHQGHRVPLDEVRASAPHSGFIRVTREPGGRLGQWSRTALLVPTEDSIDVTIQLHSVQLQAWDVRGVVIAGVERNWYRKQRTNYRQSWFVVFPGEASVVAKPPRAATAPMSSRGGCYSSV